MAEKYSREVADRICALMRAGQSVVAICRMPGMPRDRTVRDWVQKDRDGFAARYKAAVGNTSPDGCYSEELATLIFTELAKGRTLQEVCRQPGMPNPSTVLRWAQRDFNGFAEDYRIARELGYRAMLDEMLAIADDDSGDMCLDSSGQPVPNPANVVRARLRLGLHRQRLAQAMPKTGARAIDQGAVRRGDARESGKKR